MKVMINFKPPITFFRTIKLLLFILAIVATISVFFSSWWLRPLCWDGARHTFLLIHQKKLVIDFIRYSHVLFQFPAYIAEFFGTSPLALARIYFLSITLFVYGILGIKIYKSETPNQLLVPASLLFIGLIPGISYTINSMLETALFFMLFQSYLVTGQRKVWFYITGLLAVLGHQSIFAALIISAILFCVLVKERKKTDLVFLFILILISGYLLYLESVLYPGVSGHWSRIVTNYMGKSSIQVRMY